MNKQDLIDRLRGETWHMATGTPIPVDSISIESLADLLLDLFEPRDTVNAAPEKAFSAHHELKPGVRVTPNGRFVKKGKFISESEAYK